MFPPLIKRSHSQLSRFLRDDNIIIIATCRGLRTKGTINGIPKEAAGAGKYTAKRVSRATALQETVKGYPAGGAVWAKCMGETPRDTFLFMYDTVCMNFSNLQFRFSPAPKIHVWPHSPTVAYRNLYLPISTAVSLKELK